MDYTHWMASGSLIIHVAIVPSEPLLIVPVYFYSQMLLLPDLDLVVEALCWMMFGV